MSMKAIKDGKEYPIGVIPQNYPGTVYFEEVTVTTDANGYANIKDKAPINKTVSVTVISPYRYSAELWVNNSSDTGYYAYIYSRGINPSALASQSVTLRICKSK